MTRKLYYISAPDGLAAIYVKPQSGQASMYYVHTDHLGSIVLLTDSAGVAVFKASYDAWGKQTVSLNTFGFYRGYTGHEHLPEFGLINMNGRMYDPVLGRFLSPDNYVQAADFSQNFNRYSYCVNNPLKFTDPSGEIFWFFAGAIIGAYIGGSAANNDWNPLNGGWDFSNPETYMGIVGGGLAGGLGAQWLLGPGGVVAGGTPLNISLGASYGNLATAFADISIGAGSGITFQGIGYATAAGGGAYIAGSAINNLINGGGPKFQMSPEQKVDMAIINANIKAINQGEIRPYEPDFFDNWSESDNFLASTAYQLVDGISVTAQSFIIGPEAEHLNGERVSGYDRSDAFVNTTSWALASTAVYKNVNSNNWLRIGKGLDKGQEVFRVAWGAHPRYLKQINNPYLREFNKWLRKLGGGHFDIWRY